MSSSNCCLLTCIQVSLKAGKVVWYSYLFKNFPVCCDPHKGFSIVNKAGVDVFLEFSCFFLRSNRCWQFEYYSAIKNLMLLSNKKKNSIYNNVDRLGDMFKFIMILKSTLWSTLKNDRELTIQKSKRKRNNPFFFVPTIPQ